MATTTETTTVTLERVEALTTQLPPTEQLRLIERLAAQLAGASRPTTVQRGDWDQRWAMLRADLGALPAQRLASEQLEADREERQALLEGRDAHT